MSELNKYNLTIESIKNLKVNKELLYKHLDLFLKNQNYANSWCLSRSCGDGYNNFFFRISETKVEDISFTSDYGMTVYNFNEFFSKKCNKYDILIQKMFLSQINKLIDLGVLYRTRVRLLNGYLVQAKNGSKYIFFGGIGYNIKTFRPVIYDSDLDENYSHIYNDILSITQISRIDMYELLDSIPRDIYNSSTLMHQASLGTFVYGKHINGQNKEYIWVDEDNVANDVKVGDIAIVETKKGDSYIKVTRVEQGLSTNQHKKVKKIISVR